MEIFGPSPLVRLGKSASNLFRKNGMPIFELRVGSIHAKMSTTLKEEKFYHAERYKYLVLANTISKSLYCINRNVHPDPVGAVS